MACSVVEKEGGIVKTWVKTWVIIPNKGGSNLKKRKMWGKIVLHLLIIGILGYDWDEGPSVGIHPNFIPSQTPTDFHLVNPEL